MKGSSAFSTAHCRRGALRRREQQPLGRGVLLHGSVKIQMIAREVGEYGGVEVEAVDPPQREPMEETSGDQMVAAGAFPVPRRSA